MTAPALPALLSVSPAATAPAPASRPSSGFATALDDALGSDGGTPQPGPEATTPEDDVPVAPPLEGDAGPAEEAPAGPQVLDPAAWAFALAVAVPAPPATVAPDAADPAAAPAGAVPPVAAAADGVPAPALLPGAAGPVAAVPATPGGPLPLDAVLPGAPAAPSPAATATPVVPTAATPGAADLAAVLPAGVVVVPAAVAPTATASSPAPTADAVPAVATELPLAALPPGQEQTGADPRSGGSDQPAAQLTPGAAPAAPATTSAAPATPALAAPAPPPPVATQVAPVVAQLAGGPDGTHTMTLVLTPETLGTVEVRVTVSAGTVDLTLRHASEAGRAALLDALPDLRRDLESAGLSCSKLDVDRDSGSSWTSQHQAAEQWAAAREAGTGRGRPWLRGDEPDGSRPAPVVHPASSGLDVRV